MSEDIRKIEKQAQGLPPKDRARLAMAPIESLDEGQDEDVEELWLDEAERVAMYYEGKRPGLGTLFLSETRKARNRIVELAAATREVRDSIRRGSVQGFPYFLYYAIE